MSEIFDLKDRSIEIITSNQHESGAYVACPNFSIYKYCWLKDGAFTAYAMDIWDRSDSAGKFFDWTHGVISKQQSRLKKILDMKKREDILLNDDYLPTRYMLNGNECNDEWPNFQLDGYGVWLWALSEHVRITKDEALINKYEKSIKVAVEYLVEFWNYPCFDLWQENGEKVHTSTLASICGGLNRVNEYLKDIRIDKTVKDIKDYLLTNCVVDGRFKKCSDIEDIDASSMWTTIPFHVFKVNDSIVMQTIEEIEGKLLHNGGVHRYTKDSYYGGGEWIVTSALLGLYYCERKEADKARVMLQWIENRANENGELPEQSIEHVNDVHHITKWKSLWGEVASPVLWSHAMYLILLYNIKRLI